MSRRHLPPHEPLARRGRPHPVRRLPALLPAEGGPGRALFRPGRAGGEIVLTTYGRSSGFCVDPIEKKPLNHFLPGSSVLSFGTAGCNLACRFCQNWDISKSREIDTLADAATPERIAAAARRAGLPERRVHVQRPRRLHGVRDRRRRGVPRRRRQDRRRHGRLRGAEAARGALRRDGRRERGPQGVHRGLLPRRRAAHTSARPRDAGVPRQGDARSGPRSRRS